MNKIYYIIAFFIIISIVVIVAVITKNSIKELPENSDYFSYIVEQAPVSVSIHDLEFYDECVRMADLIAKVIYTGNREQLYQNSLSEVIILDVYKGDKDLIGRLVDIFEFGRFYAHYEKYRGSFYNIMQEGKEYYAFLLSKNYIDEYQEIIGKYRYQPYPFEFSILAVEDGQVIYIDKDDTYLYKDIADYEFYCYTEEEYNDVFLLKKEIIDKYITDINK